MSFQDLPQPDTTPDGRTSIRWMSLLWKTVRSSAGISVDWSQIILPTEAANTVLAGPIAGPDATVTFRALTAADIPGLGSGRSFAAAHG